MNSGIQDKVKRVRERGAYDRQTAESILDAGFMCHVGFCDEGQPYVIPMLYARRDDELLLHGSIASRLQRTLAEGIAVCVTVTHLDGLVLARSAFEHSANYRSVLVFGNARPIDDPGARLEALEHLLEYLVPGRSVHARGTNRKELAATSVLTMPIERFSAKTREGPPEDLEADYALPVWAGEVPLRVVADAPVPDPRLDPSVGEPDYVTRFRSAPNVAAPGWWRPT